MSPPVPELKMSPPVPDQDFAQAGISDPSSPDCTRGDVSSPSTLSDTSSNTASNISKHNTANPSNSNCNSARQAHLSSQIIRDSKFQNENEHDPSFSTDTSPTSPTLHNSLFRPFPFPLTLKQSLYIIVTQCVVAGLIDGGANFGIAYAMYRKQYVGDGGSGREVRMWPFQNTIAGDLGVTPVIQCTLSMLITSTLVHTDLHHNMITPLPFVYPHVDHLPNPLDLLRRMKSRLGCLVRRKERTTMTAGTHCERDLEKQSTDDAMKATDPALDTLRTSHSLLTYYFLMFLRFVFEGTEYNIIISPRHSGSPPFLSRLTWTTLQGLALSLLFGFPLWCLFIVILGPLYGNRVVGNLWAPQIIKGVYGAVLGWLTNPVIALIALGSQAEQHLIVTSEGKNVDVNKGEKNDKDTNVEVTSSVQQENRDERAQIQPSSISTSTSPVPIQPATNAVATPPRGNRQPSVVSSASSQRQQGGRRRQHSLTADANQMSIVGDHNPIERSTSTSPATSTSQPRPIQTSLTPTPTPTRLGRPRALTSTSTSTTTSHYSYSLGGTGGRAQRPRASSRASNASNFQQQPPPLPSSSDVTQQGARQRDRTMSDLVGSGTPRGTRSRAFTTGTGMRLNTSTNRSREPGSVPYLATPSRLSAIAGVSKSPRTRSPDWPQPESEPGPSSSSPSHIAIDNIRLTAPPSRLIRETGTAASAGRLNSGLDSTWDTPRESMEIRAEERDEV